MAPTPNGQYDVEAGIGQDHFKLVLTGKTWAIIRESFPELLPRICTMGAVFARMSSEQKQQLVQELQGLGYYVGQYKPSCLFVGHEGTGWTGSIASIILNIDTCLG
jgi:Cation transport ATPase